jgi:hypothetical protein
VCANWLDPLSGIEYDFGVFGPLIVYQSKEATLKKTTKLELKKVTLRNLDEPTLNAVAGGEPIPTLETCHATCLKTFPNGTTCINCK